MLVAGVFMSDGYPRTHVRTIALIDLSWTQKHHTKQQAGRPDAVMRFVADPFDPKQDP
jgi:hypothetical protein